MFLKLCKHELKCSYRSFLLLYIVLLLVSFIFNPNTRSTFTAFTMFLFVSVQIALFIMCIVTVVRNYHNTMFTRNSYLTHTLPVSESKLMLTKIVSAVFWSFLSLGVILLSVLIVVYRTSGFDMDLMNTELQLFMQRSNVQSFPVLLLVLYWILSIINTITLVYFSMNVTYTTHIQKYRVVTAFIIYVAISRFTALCIQVFGITNINLESLFSAPNIRVVSTQKELFIFFTIACIISITLTVVYFLASKYILEHKLEIE